LPGETLESFGNGFDQLMALDPQEIQVGILKRLRGTPIDRHTEPFDMRYQPTPPYRIVSNADVNFSDVQRIVRFARYWDLIANSGRFPKTLPFLLGDKPFANFLASSDWVFNTTGQTHKIALSKLFSLLYQLLTDHFKLSEEIVIPAMQADFNHNRLKGNPKFLPQAHNKRGDIINAVPAENEDKAIPSLSPDTSSIAKRQSRHQQPRSLALDN